MNDWKWQIGGTGKKISLYEEVYKTLYKNIDKDLKVYVASDSQNYSTHTNMTAIVVIRLGNNGCRIFVASKKMPRIGRIIPRGESFGKEDYASLRRRLLEEAHVIVQTALLVEPICAQVENDYFEATGRIRNIQFETEADVNDSDRWASNKFLHEVVGYIKAFGFTVNHKPNSTMASNAADHYVKR